MKTINQAQYTRLNKALHNLEDLLSSIGVKEFCISRESKRISINTDTEDVNIDLLDRFCAQVEQMHDNSDDNNIGSSLKNVA